MGAETELVLVWWMLLGLLVRSCWGAGFCGLEIQQQNKLYKFNLASPLRDYPHGVLSEDGFASKWSSTMINLYVSDVRHVEGPYIVG